MSLLNKLKNQNGFSGVIVILVALLVVGFFALFMISQLKDNELEVETNITRSEVMPVTKKDYDSMEKEPVDDLTAEDEEILPAEVTTEKINEIDDLIDTLDADDLNFDDLGL